MNDGKLKNRVAYVTGAGTGLGRAIAIAFANEGATVVLNGRREEKLREVEKEISEANGSALVIPADLTDEKAVLALRDQLLENTNGKLDILVNNAGGVSAMGSVGELTLDQWNQMMELNLTTQFLATKAFLPALRENGNGKIMSVTSLMANYFMEGYGGYSASKAAVEALMKTIAAEEKENGIQVNLFDPVNIISESNPGGATDPAEIVGVLIDLAAASGVEKSGEIVKP